MSQPQLVFRVAEMERDLEQIHRLNYRTFVEEIPQHQPNGERMLRDKFDAENTYVVALSGERLVGMIAVRDRRPFSLDSKLPNLDVYLPRGHVVCEVRLLSVEREFRSGFVFRGLMNGVAQLFASRGYTLAIISGTVKQLKLYGHVGFVPFGPTVGSDAAKYQPMYLTFQNYLEKHPLLATATDRPVRGANFLPGPTNVHSEVRAALFEAPVSHRDSGFEQDLRETRGQLLHLTSALNVQILLGSGTLANDVAGAQLAQSGDPGVVLVNGEFGERLADHAARWELPHKVHRAEWGEAIDRASLDRTLAAANARWVWAAHCETSTGVINDLDMLRELCDSRGAKLALDCISSVGCVPVNLSGVYLATATSGKGLGAYPGLSMVFHSGPPVASSKRIPRYLDLALYAAEEEVPFTHSSNLVRALLTALRRRNWPEWFRQVSRDNRHLRTLLSAANIPVLVRADVASPAVTTIPLPSEVAASNVGELLERRGYQLSFRSGYLRRRNWLQVCLMGEYESELIPALAEAIEASIRTASR